MPEHVAGVMDVLSRRQQCRDEWLDTVAQAWDRLDPAIRRHCVDHDNLLRWWPGTAPAGEEGTP